MRVFSAQSAQKPIPADAVVVSFTTTPPRIKMVGQMVRTLFMQKDLARPLHIYCAVPRTFRGKPVKADLVDMAATLSGQKDLVNPSIMTNVEVEWADDVGPATKVVWAGLKYSAHPVVSVDDDIEYNERFVKILLDSLERSPTSVVSASVGRMVPGIPAISHVLQHSNLSRTAGNILEGFSGVAYPPNFFISERQQPPTAVSTPGHCPDGDLVSWLQELPHVCKVSDDFVLSRFAECRGYVVKLADNLPSECDIMENCECDEIEGCSRWLKILHFGGDGSTPSLHLDKIAGDADCPEGMPAGQLCTTNTLHYERCRAFLDGEEGEVQPKLFDALQEVQEKRTARQQNVDLSVVPFHFWEALLPSMVLIYIARDVAVRIFQTVKLPYQQIPNLEKSTDDIV